MKTLRFVPWGLLVGFMGILMSCGTTAKLPGTTTSITGDMALSTLTPPEGKALVYILRPSRIGTAMKFAVELDGNEIGFTYGKKFVYTFAEPGKHIFIGRAENIYELPIQLEANKIYFIEQKPKSGLWTARNKLIRLDDLDGSKKLKKCKLSGDNATLEGFTPPNNYKK
ncbi:MAG: DUF2846 domain-containing protein [Bacteroidota bacterium]